MRHDLYITGTDTDVGKTYVAARLIAKLVAQGERIAVMKPVASGCNPTESGALRNEDALLLMQASNVEAHYARVNPFAFEPAIAPEYAANRVGQPVDLDVIRGAFESLKAQSDRVVVEGAGGWLSPVNATLDQVDVMKALGIRDVILVVGMKLGCVHNARATWQAINTHASSSMRCVGWVANEATGNDPELPDNINAIRRYIDAPLLATMRHRDASHVEWQAIPT